MTEISGTPKQIAWAEKIRAGLNAGILTKADASPHRTNPREAILRPAIERAAAAITDAKWWIDHRPAGSPGKIADRVWSAIPQDYRQAITALLAEVKAGREVSADTIQATIAGIGEATAALIAEREAMMAGDI